MSAQLIDGNALAQTIRAKIKERVAALSSQPGLAVILVGADPASHTYVGIKQKACEEAGIRFEKILYFATESEETVIEKIRELNAREDIHGILVQLPLPTQNADNIIPEIDPNKDVDGFHPKNLERLKLGQPCIASAVALGILKLIDAATKVTSGLTATIVSSERFAEPIVALLRERGIKAVVSPEEDPLLKSKTSASDILIVAEGHPGFIKGDMVKPGAIVIDVGTTKIDGKLYGDVDQTSVEPVAGFLTPVPGGVGPMTVAMLLVNVLKAYSLSKGLKADL
ncbi:MAG: bifunctional 5,10-methylenetetrahydrofolate dehydrogenase/5,10-methenyltetrahydrofolate cyclohydrolase [Patescibacteria group bacterium]